MILVAGGSGRLGTLIVQRLAARGHSVQALTRDPERASQLAGEHVEIVRGDVRDAAAVATACAGAEVVVSAIHGFIGPRGNTPVTVDRDGNVNLIDAAASARAHVVLVSVLGAAPDSPMELFRMKHAAESYLLASGIPATIVRAAAFMETWTEILQKTAGRSGRPLVFGKGDNPINFVSAGDVASLVVHAVTDPATRGRTLEIGGPENLTLNAVARALQAAHGRTGSPRHVPRIALRLAAQTVGRVNPIVDRQVRAAVAMDTAVDLGTRPADVRASIPGIPNTTIGTCLGRRSAAVGADAHDNLTRGRQDVHQRKAKTPR